MWSFNLIYSLGKGQPNPDHVTMEEPLPKTRCDIFTDWIKWTISYPIVLTHSLCNIALLFMHKEFHNPTLMNIYSGNKINFMPIPRKPPFHIVSSPAVISAILHHARNDNDGFFKGKAAADVLFPLLKDLFHEKIEDDDFLLTCFKDATPLYRKPILDLMGPQNSRRLQEQLVEIVAEMMKFLKTQEKDGIIKINAAELTVIFSTAVIAKVLFNYRPDNETLQKIQHNLAILIKYQLLRQNPFKPSKEQTKEYYSAISHIQEIIKKSDGPSQFNEVVKVTSQSDQLPDLRRKGLILLLYIAGGEPPSGLLQYMFWRLGQEQTFQHEIFQELIESKTNSLEHDCPKLEAFIAECLRMFTPGTNFTRFAAKDFDLVFHAKGKCIYKYRIKENEGILYSIHTAGRDQHKFPDPHEFKPQRFLLNEDKPLSNASLSWAPFSKKRHSCPGKKLATLELQSLPPAVLREYSIWSSPNKKELKVKGLPTTAEIGETVTLTLKRR